MPLATIPDAIVTFRAGRFVIIIDDEDRENEGDLVIAAEAVTPEAIAFMARHASGLICVPMLADDIDRMGLPLMVPPDGNGTRFGTAFTVSVEARTGVTTGISAHDRARTIQVLTDPASQPSDIVQPGHIFPLRCHPGGVLTRAGQTEASVKLAQLSGMRPAAVICEIMDDDGRMARMPSLERFAQRHAIPIISTTALIDWILTTEGDRRHEPDAGPIIRPITDIRLPTTTGPFRLHAYQDISRPVAAEPHLALVAGDPRGPEPLLARIHSECLTGDVFGSSRCDCGQQLDLAIERVAERGRGV
ncbi:MAG: 3,4-dihydroxy-2-butanone-4-phosphate synthase, partial [Thermomicrobiales bacterium]